MHHCMERKTPNPFCTFAQSCLNTFPKIVSLNQPSAIKAQLFMLPAKNGTKLTNSNKKNVQYCAKVMQTNFDEIPGFSGLFEEISLETIY